MNERVGLVIVAMFVFGSCANSAECEEGKQLRGSSCFDSSGGSSGNLGGAGADSGTASGGAEGTTDGGGATSSAGAAGASSQDFFGKECSDNKTHGECGGNAAYCALQTGHSVGYCTTTGCVKDASVCPKDWSCLDLSVFDPTLPSICRKP